MRFDDELFYGVVLTRLSDGAWWHGHLVRSNLLYTCELLNRRTTMLFLIQKFGRGGAALSRKFFLTLDGEGVTAESEIKCSSDWGEVSGTPEDKAAASDIRETLGPLLYENRQFQHGMWFIVTHSEYESVADLEQMERVVVPPFSFETPW